MSPGDAADSIVRMEDVWFAYERYGAPPRQVLRGVCLDLRPGQRVGLYGPNGSGKTTLFRCLTGLIRPQRGRVCFHGAPLGAEKDFRPLRCAVGFVLQHADDQLFFPTVLEDVAFGPLNLGLGPDEARRRAADALRSLGLEGFEDRLIHRLSGGQKKLVALAGVLAMRPEALLLDEPTNDLDADARRRLIDILDGLSTARITVSHDWDFLARVSDTWLTLDNGRLAAGAPAVSHAHTHAHPLGDAPHAHD